MVGYGYDCDYKSLNERVHVLVLAHVLAPVFADFAAADVNSAKSAAVD